MNKKIYYNFLYDYYKELLTDKQRDYFEDYYFDDLSLKEISENRNVSRNAAFNQIKSVEEKLDLFEEKLSLYNNSNKIKEIIKNLDKDIKDKIEGLI